MYYVLSLICPPLALLLCLRPISATFNAIFWIIGLCLLPAAGLGLLLVIPCIIHAWSTVSSDFANDRNKAVVREMRNLKRELRRKAS